MKAYDLVGERFGRLQVISKVEKGNGRSNWLYQCDCGNQKIIDGYSLKSGRSTSCGCYKKEINEKRHIEALEKKQQKQQDALIMEPIGKEYGYLKILSYAYSKNKHKYYLCLCKKCLSYVIVRYSNLTSGHIISCGCVKSAGEEKIAQWLVRHCINFKKQYAFADCKDKYVLRFDFAILNAESQVIALIEVDGEQHYRAINFFGGEENLEYNQLHDKIKSDYCKENNLPLIRISYIDLRNGQYEQILDENIVVLGSQQSHSQE